MKVLTLLGTRPEIIRLSRVIEGLDRLCQHVLVHTGQNFDPNLSDIFFEQLRLRRPDHALGVTGETFGQQIGRMLVAVDGVLREERPGRRTDPRGREHGVVRRHREADGHPRASHGGGERLLRRPRA